MTQDSSPYQTPTSTANASSEIADLPKNFEGMGRVKFFFYYVGIILSITAFFALLKNYSVEDLKESLKQNNIGIIFVLFILIFTVAGSRLKNIGLSRWFSLMTAVPLVNIYYLWLCFAAPAGYRFTKRLDVLGKIITGILAILLTTILVKIFLSLIPSTQLISTKFTDHTL